MPIFIAALLGGLATAMGSLVGRVLIALGIGYVTYSGLNVLLDWIKNEIFGQLMGINSDVLGIIGVLQVDTSVNIIFSAIAAKFMISGISNGAVTRMVIK